MANLGPIARGGHDDVVLVRVAAGLCVAAAEGKRAEARALADEHFGPVVRFGLDRHWHEYWRVYTAVVFKQLALAFDRGGYSVKDFTPEQVEALIDNQAHEAGLVARQEIDTHPLRRCG